MIRIFPCLPYNQENKTKQSVREEKFNTDQSDGSNPCFIVYSSFAPFYSSQCIEVLPTISEEKESLFLTF